jgi:hypothetical protein
LQLALVPPKPGTGLEWRRIIRHADKATVCVVFLVLSVSVGLAQAPPQRLAPDSAPVGPSTNAPGPQPTVPPSSEQNSGVLETLGRWFDESVANMNKGLQSTLGASDAASKGAAEAASGMAKGAAEAAGAVGRLGTSRVVSGQALCTIAPNGAPDCRLAAESLCKTKGFSSGSSVDYVTSEKCPTQTIVAGRRPAPGECVTEHTVTRALCQ